MPWSARRTDPRLRAVAYDAAPAPALAPPPPAGAPAISALTHRECEAVLLRNTVGRLAFSTDSHVDVQPLHYVYEDGWIYGRTSPGAKITAIRHSHWVAFEVDEPEDVFSWRSVVVRGGLYFLEADGPGPEREERVAALALLSRVVPATGTPADPVPGRTIVFRIHTSEVTGRVAAPSR